MSDPICCVADSKMQTVEVEVSKVKYIIPKTYDPALAAQYDADLDRLDKATPGKDKPVEERVRYYADFYKAKLIAFGMAFAKAKSDMSSAQQEAKKAGERLAVISASKADTLAGLSTELMAKLTGGKK